MTKEDLYDKCILVTENNFQEIQTILFELGFVWCSSGKKYITKALNYIMFEKDTTDDISFSGDTYRKDIMYSDSGGRRTFINGDNFIRKFKIKKLNE